MEVLVTAASRHGATAGIAVAIATVLEDRGLAVTVLDPSEVVRVEGYDAVVLGSAVYAGHWLSSARQLAARFQHQLVARPVWLFSSGPVGDPPRPLETATDVPALLAMTEAREHVTFAGRLDRGRLGLAERAVARATRVADGDARDWAEIADWSASIADVLVREQPLTGS